MTPAERTAKIAELRAEADRLEREARLDALLALRDEVAKMAWPRGAPYCADLIAALDATLDAPYSILCKIVDATPDAPEPTGVELRGAKLIGKLCDFSEDGIYWEDYQGGRECNAYAPPAGYSWGMQGRWFKFARLHRGDQP